MRLLHIETEELHIFPYPPPVPYAILSRAGSSPAGGERLRDGSSPAIISGHQSTLRADILQFCKLAREAQFQFVWVDTLCVDKTSSADISETINSLPGYFQHAGLCFVFLEDLRGGPSLPWEDTWAKCQYWTRAWTLQELLLPAKVQFYDAQWRLRGERSTHPLPSLISGITGIDKDILTRRRRLHQTSVARRMSWAARREGARPEDASYSLLGIFDVRMPIVYGEGGRRAFRRLQEEILKSSNDMSLFSWTSDVADDSRGIFANSPGEFFRFGTSPGAQTPCISPGFAALTSRGVLVEGQCYEEGQILYLDLGVQTRDEVNTKRYGILLEKRTDGTFQRTKSNVLEELPTGEVLATARIMATKGSVDVFDPASSVASKVPSSLEKGLQNLPFRHAITISLSHPTTPGFSRQSSGSSGSETTPTAPSFSSSCPSHLEEPDWVSIQHENQGAAESDDCDELGGYGSMETSQQTEADRGWDSISEASTAPSPPQDETEEPCHPSANRLRDPAITKSTSTTIHQSSFPAAIVGDSQQKEQLSQFLLSQFVASHETSNHVAEKRERREKRSRDRSRQPAQKPKKRALGPPEFSCPFYVKNPERHVGCLINHELVSVEDVREHVWLHHRLPCYCPTCKAVFESAVERDVHIVQRSCRFIDNFPFEGVSEDHRQLIFHTRDSANSSTQWLRIWDILFPDVEVDRSKTVYISDSLGLKVSAFRSFFRKYGRGILSEQLLARYPKAAMPEETTIENLLSEVRSDIMRALVHDFFRQGSCTRYTLSC